MPMCSRLFPTFSSIRFSESGFIWRSLIHLDISFVQGDKNGSICLLLHDNRQLNQHHLLKMLSFFQLNGFTSFVKDQVTRGVWVHFWVFNSIPLIYPASLCTNTIKFLSLLLCNKLEVRDGDFPRSSFVENSFCFPRFFVIPNEFANCCF